MSLPLIRQDFLNIAFLSNYCVASYPGYVAIGELNPTHGFNENQYIKIHYVDFESFLASAEQIHVFFSGDTESDVTEEGEILQTKSKYIIKWSGENRISSDETKVDIFVEVEKRKTFSILLNCKEFFNLLECFSNVALNSFLLTPYHVACLQEFLNDLKTQKRDKEYVRSLSNEDYLKVANDLCKRLEIPSLNSYSVRDKMIYHQVDIMLFMEFQKLFPSRKDKSDVYLSLRR
jgi:hypothetical protein